MATRFFLPWWRAMAVAVVSSDQLTWWRAMAVAVVSSDQLTWWRAMAENTGKIAILPKIAKSDQKM